jgi:hypothetical protein
VATAEAGTSGEERAGKPGVAREWRGPSGSAAKAALRVLVRVVLGGGGVQVEVDSMARLHLGEQTEALQAGHRYPHLQLGMVQRQLAQRSPPRARQRRHAHASPLFPASGSVGGRGGSAESAPGHGVAARSAGRPAGAAGAIAVLDALVAGKEAEAELQERQREAPHGSQL